jgi:hypothetical protein
MSKKECKTITLEQAQFVKNEWHLVYLTEMNLVPSKEYFNEDFDYDFDEIKEIINKYGISPPSNHWYWNSDLKKQFTNVVKFNVK